MLAPIWRLDVGHHRQKLVVVSTGVDAGVHSTMTIGAEANDEPGVVWSAVANAADVVRFEVRAAISAQERRLVPAAFAMPFRPMQDVSFHVDTALVDISRGALSRCPNACGLVGSIAQVNRIDGLALFGCDSNVLHLLADGIQEAQLKDDSVTHLSVRVRGPLNAMVLVYHFAFKPQWSTFILEEQQAASLGGMISDSEVPLDHAHVVYLPLAIVVEHAVVSQNIRIAVSQPGFAADDYDQRVSSRRDDPAPLLPIKPSMYVRAPVIDAANLKSPRHRFPPVCKRQANGEVRDSKATRAAA